MIYMDHSATSPVDKEVFDVMAPFFTEEYGNASTLYSLGRQARISMELARQSIASLIRAQSDEIIFTSGGTESDNIAIKGIAYLLKDKGNHIITSDI